MRRFFRHATSESGETKRQPTPHKRDAAYAQELQELEELVQVMCDEELVAAGALPPRAP